MNFNNDYINTNLLKFIAILLIMNSHMDHYYPIPALASGGSLGNSLFFMLSSYGLFFSYRKKPRGFEEYYIHRIKRLYWPVWVALTFILLPMAFYFDEFIAQKLLVWIGYYFYPPFWFLQILLVYYFFGYFLLKRYSDIKIYFIVSGVIGMYFFIYYGFLDLSVFSLETIPFRFIYYFIIFLFGFYIANNISKINFDGIIDYIILLIVFGSYVVLKLLVSKGLMGEYQFIIHILTITIVFYLFKINKSEFIQIYMNTETSYIAKLINYLGMITLEIYIIHAILFNHVLHRMHLGFPENAIISFFLAFIFASLLNFITKIIQLYLIQIKG